MSRSVHANLKLQQAMQADAGILAAMNQKLIRDEGHRNRMNLEELTQRMKEFLLGEYRAVLFVLDESVVGYTLFKFDPDAVYVRQFYVSQDFRRQGLAARRLHGFVPMFGKSFYDCELTLSCGTRRESNFGGRSALSTIASRWN